MPDIRMIAGSIKGGKDDHDKQGLCLKVWDILVSRHNKFVGIVLWLFQLLSSRFIYGKFKFKHCTILFAS